MWADGIDWDDNLDDNMELRVNRWFEELNHMTSIKVPRCLQVYHNKSLSSLTLHVFVDASQDAYATVIYCRNTYEDGTVYVGFVASKTRVAPLTAVSIPRLGLMAAVIGLRLASTTSKVIEIPMKDVTFWSDSSNVLYWIRGRSRQFKPFVSNRVGKIQGIKNPNQWRYVPTKQNPADVATRGSNIRSLADNQLWWQGPEFLIEEKTNWPTNKFEKCASKEQTKEEKEVKIHNMINCAQSNTHLKGDQTSWRLEPTRFSKWVSLTRLQAWVLRFVNNCRLPHSQRNRGESPDEINDAEININKTAQQDGFSTEFQQLSCGKILKNDSKIIGLQQKIDDDGLMRSDGRLKFAEFLPYDVRYPIILPRKNWVTKLIVKHHHEKGFHVSGTNHTLSSLSERYWIVCGREEIEWEKECAECKKRKAKSARQIMAPLPEKRIKSSLCAFSRVAVDYGGPFITIQGREKRRAKRYLCLFTCLATRAVHLEMAYALDTNSFLNAFYRMVNRRGLPKEVVSDNGGNFIGADKELRELIISIDKDKVQKSTANRGIKWHFNPPLAPHFGGVHEKIIKSAKRATYAILKNADITDEELITTFTGVESLINSRQLTYQSANPNDDTPLTPNHFLHGQVGGEFAPDSVDTTKFNPMRRWRRVQELVKHVCRR
ncbi:uncharacterized protein LOC117107577 [Anneissia japonica]|uniref:uncharacterized protein LOC117107577 n=1 Tax=Anneissia japonica TaxID=1529436 RepID=UPI001425AEE0|nr:uncharacterized protein LOC117107577 [Anneissia japonica]